MNTEQILKSCQTITLGREGIDDLLKDSDKIINLEKENAKLKEKLNELEFIGGVIEHLDSFNTSTQLSRNMYDTINNINNHFVESSKKYKVEFVRVESALGVSVNCLLSKR